MRVFNPGYAHAWYSICGHCYDLPFYSPPGNPPGNFKHGYIPGLSCQLTQPCYSVDWASLMQTLITYITYIFVRFREKKRGKFHVNRYILYIFS